MTNQPPVPESEFDDLLAEFTQRLRDREQPDVADYVQRFPEHREQIEELFPVIACL